MMANDPSEVYVADMAYTMQGHTFLVAGYKLRVSIHQSLVKCISVCV